MRIQGWCLALLMSVSFPAIVSASEGCYICGSGSSNGCKQCSYGSKDTFDARKACEKKGCKVGGTTSCSTASNVKMCMAPSPDDGPTAALEAGIPWCAQG